MLKDVLESDTLIDDDVTRSGDRDIPGHTRAPDSVLASTHDQSDTVIGHEYDVTRIAARDVPGHVGCPDVRDGHDHVLSPDIIPSSIQDQSDTTKRFNTLRTRVISRIETRQQEPSVGVDDLYANRYKYSYMFFCL